MSSEVEICKLALSEVRGGNINSLDDPTVPAQQCKLKYPIFRDQLLASHDFSFNQSIKALALLTDTIFDWEYVYQYPVDCLYVKEIIPNVESSIYSYDRPFSDPVTLFQNDVEYKVLMNNDVKVIVSNHPDLRINYRRSVSDPNFYEHNFRMALSYIIAAGIAVPLAGIKEGTLLKQGLLEMHEYYLNKALMSSANQQSSYTPDSEFITVRN